MFGLLAYLVLALGTLSWTHLWPFQAADADEEEEHQRLIRSTADNPLYSIREGEEGGHAPDRPLEAVW